MSRTSTLILLGILVILTPFSGLPVSFRTILTVVFGVAVTTIGLFIRGEEARAHEHQTVSPDSSPETTPETASRSEMSAI